jgi:hypothetical protein
MCTEQWWSYFKRRVQIQSARAQRFNGQRGMSSKEPPHNAAMDAVVATLARLQGQMSDISDKMDTKFESMSERLSDSVESQLANFKPSTQKPVFKGRGNEKQFDFITTMETNHDNIESNIKAGKHSSALDMVYEGNETMKKRKKLVCYADVTSWATANEYEGPSLAEGSDDEKKMRNAESLMERRARGASSKGRTSRSSRYYHNAGTRGSFRGGRSYQNDERISGRGGSCYECGRQGHWARECRDKKSSGSSSYGGRQTRKN